MTAAAPNISPNQPAPTVRIGSAAPASALSPGPADSKKSIPKKTGTTLHVDTLTADKIEADKIKAKKIEADEIEARKIAAEKIKADQIKAKSIEVKKDEAEFSH